jgi:hypothetical protein
MFGMVRRVAQVLLDTCEQVEAVLRKGEDDLTMEEIRAFNTNFQFARAWDQACPLVSINSALATTPAAGT